MKLAWLTALAFLVLVAPARAADDEEDAAPVELTLTAWDEHDGVERPFRYIVEMRARGAEPTEIVADRRLLRFEVRPTEGRRRRHRCRYPGPRSRVDEDRVRTLQPGESWREWIDLRMYCTGRALEALSDGATVEATYGFGRRASRRRWVARVPESPRREWIARLEPAPITFEAIPEETTTELDAEAGAPSPIEVSLSRTSARTGGGVVFRTAIRASEGRERVYDRPDAWIFRVRGPRGEVVCQVPMGGGSPPPDLFSRITSRRASRQRLDADYFCPDDAFEVAGVYEVTPEVRLPHSGEEWELEAVTGHFVGPTVPIRITRGSEGYVEHVPQRTPPGPVPQGT